MILTIILIILTVLTATNFVLLLLIDKHIAENGGKSIFWEERK